MAYSRWSNSRWYTYWSCNSGEKIGNQILCIDGDWDFTYDQLKHDLDTCLNIVMEEAGSEPTEDELTELERYISWFLKDVEHEYKLSS